MSEQPKKTPCGIGVLAHVKAGNNTVRVEVDNSLEPNCRWYSGSGIYRPVSLIIREKNHISRVRLETVDIHPARVRVDVATTQSGEVTEEF